MAKYFLQYLALDITANCIFEIHCLALDAFDLNTVHKLSNKGKKRNILAKLGFEPRAAGWKARVLPLCHAATLCLSACFCACFTLISLVLVIWDNYTSYKKVQHGRVAAQQICSNQKMLRKTGNSIKK